MLIMRITLGVIIIPWLYIAWKSYQEKHFGLMTGSLITALVCLAGVIL